MDPLAIGGGGLALITTIVNVSKTIYSFVKQVRQTRTDLDAISRELSLSKLVLALLMEDDENENIKFPEALTWHICGIVANCQHVVGDIEDFLEKYKSDTRGRSVSWTLSSQDDMSKLRRSIEAHKSALDLGLNMLALYA